jgi:uncharacterized protein (UPF0332 family)
MAVLASHLALAETLHADMERAHGSGEWPIAVDAGYYAVFHGMEAMNALECRDSYTFADAADILENVLVERGLGKQFVDDYRYLFYFRRGAIYGAHIPTSEQIAEFVERARRGYRSLRQRLDGQSTPSAPKSPGSKP